MCIQFWDISFSKKAANLLHPPPPRVNCYSTYKQGITSVLFFIWKCGSKLFFLVRTNKVKSEKCFYAFALMIILFATQYIFYIGMKLLCKMLFLTVSIFVSAPSSRWKCRAFGETVKNSVWKGRLHRLSLLRYATEDPVCRSENKQCLFPAT